MLSITLNILDGAQKGKKLFVSLVYSLDFIDSLMMQMCKSMGINWDTVGEITPQLVKGKIAWVKAPGTDDGFTKFVNSPMDTENDGSDDVPF